MRGIEHLPNVISKEPRLLEIFDCIINPVEGLGRVMGVAVKAEYASSSGTKS